MSESTPFLILRQPCDIAIDWAARQFSSAGLQAVRTFDLQVARHDHAGCPCPHHGKQQCDCQLVVLLVYDRSASRLTESQPVSIIAHGNNGQTWFSVVDSPQQRPNPGLEAAIRQALVPHNPAVLLDHASHPQAI